MVPDFGTPYTRNTRHYEPIDINQQEPDDERKSFDNENDDNTSDNDNVQPNKLSFNKKHSDNLIKPSNKKDKKHEKIRMKPLNMSEIEGEPNDSDSSDVSETDSDDEIIQSKIGSTGLTQQYQNPWTHQQRPRKN